jgi:hypothetical protein
VTERDEDTASWQTGLNFNDIPSRRKQPNNKHTIESIVLTDLILTKTTNEE